MADSQKLFDWSSLITPAVNLGMKALGDKVAPGADLQSVQNQERNQQFQNQLTLQKMAQANQIRQSMMPGMYTTLGFSPDQGKQMAANYGQNMPAMNFGAGGSGSSYGMPTAPKAPGLGAKIGGAALGIGTSMLPGILGKLLGGAAPAVAGAAGAGAAGAGAGGAAAAGGGAGLFGLGAATIPVVGGAIAGAALLANKLIGRGRKQANKLTGEGGLQYNFNEGLREIVAAQQSGQIDQAQRDQLVRQMYEQLKQDGAQFAQGGSKQALVVDQMLRHYLENPVTAGSLRG